MEDYLGQNESVNSCFTIAEIFEQDGDTFRAGKALLDMANKYPKSELSTKALIEAAKKFKSIKKYKEAINCLETLIQRHPDSKEVEDAFFALGFYYKEMKNDKKAIESWGRYLENYPHGKYTNIVNVQMEKEKNEK